MIDLNTLRYFTSAFETGTFSQAAQVNGVSQPTVSAAIQKLEDRLGTLLFKRSKTGLKPYPFAARLYHDVIDSVTHLAALEARLLEEPSQTVRIYCAPDMLMSHIAPDLKSLRRRFQGLQFAFADEARASDLAYVSDACIPETHAFIPLADDPFKIAVARHHPLAASREIRIEDLRAEPFIHRPYCPQADRMELAPSMVASVAQAVNDQQLLDLIAAGLGVAFVPASHGEAREDIVVLTLTGADAGARRTGISHRKTANATELAKLLTKQKRLTYPS
ncbi:putative transcriptional regulator, LysR family protein [Parvularcula bermudensis HTCC2503]|uniref:Putative transcriptional regulator, LysR family protein n=1 Tax=Parvularcula bermudensis (strain ATCC BAA-594 / HTCC2503 / KCTC 12087) TaxID=314260 RepID=E0THK5_PARBH|nr:LysR family transcriptional regulator [Parvularcula bermudensis]ADM09301.1 putative transcriptional regulator, LysR family protein [Parvularcula bermudensis HTCC2503]